MEVIIYAIITWKNPANCWMDYTGWERYITSCTIFWYTTASILLLRLLHCWTWFLFALARVLLLGSNNNHNSNLWQPMILVAPLPIQTWKWNHHWVSFHQQPSKHEVCKTTFTYPNLQEVKLIAWIKTYPYRYSSYPGSEVDTPCNLIFPFSWVRVIACMYQIKSA